MGKKYNKNQPIFFTMQQMNFCIIKINYDFAICAKYFPQQQPPTHFYIIDL